MNRKCIPYNYAYLSVAHLCQIASDCKHGISFLMEILSMIHKCDCCALLQHGMMKTAHPNLYMALLNLGSLAICLGISPKLHSLFNEKILQKTSLDYTVVVATAATEIEYIEDGWKTLWVNSHSYRVLCACGLQITSVVVNNML